MSTMWVVTLKTEENGKRKCKARLVARGFEDAEKDIIPQDSADASNASHRVVLQDCVEKQYRVYIRDYKCAFLKGKPMSRGRPVYIIVPDGFGVGKEMN